MPSNQGCNYCHMCCKKPAKPQVLRPDQPGYTEPLDIQIQKNRDLIRSLADKVNSKLSALSSMKGLTTGLVQTPTTVDGTPQLTGDALIQSVRDSKEAEVISQLQDKD